MPQPARAKPKPRPPPARAGRTGPVRPEAELTAAPAVDTRIYTVRGFRVMLDQDPAEVYGVLTKALNQAVDRNEKRFPPTSAFRLAPEEWDSLWSQIVTIKTGRGQHRKYMPRVFTEPGAVMLAAI